MDEATREGPREDRLLGIEEDTCSLLDQEVDDLGAQVSRLLVGIGDMPKALLHLPQLLLGEEGREQPLCLLTTQDVELRGILDVHNLIAYIVCGLHEVDQRMASIAQC